MAHPLLENLKKDEFACKFSFISNPRAIHGVMQRSEDVKSLRAALLAGELTEETIRKFSESLLDNFESGKQFPYESALAAIAVALETRPTPFAEEFTLDLARLDRAELAIAIRVARWACQERLAVSASKTKTFALANEGALSPVWRPVAKSRQVSVGQSEGRFEVGTA